MTNNLILMADSYKCGHAFMLPQNTTRMYSYIESRGGKFPKTLFFGLQAFIKEYLLKPITIEMIDEAEEVCTAHGVSFYREGWMHILEAHNGFLPLRIRAPKEGTLIETHNVLCTIENTDDKCPWLTSYFETALLRAIWYPTTVATNSWSCKQVIKGYLDKTSDNADGALAFALHDFGGRSFSSHESAGIGGLAHMVNFKGSDTMEALLTARRFYGEKMAAYSVSASEHSVTCAWGRDGETAFYGNLLDQFGKPGAIVSAVSDTYDVYNAVEHIWGETLRDKVIKSGAKVVIRLDSGDPMKVVKWAIRKLDEKYGSTINSKGFRVLNNVGVLQGDGVDEHLIANILGDLLVEGYSAENIVWGMGGRLVHAGIDRDTQKFACKASAVMIDGKWVDIYKDPITDPGKRSKKGRFSLVRSEDGYQTVSMGHADDQLQEVYLDGALMRDQLLAEIRDIAA